MFAIGIGVEVREAIVLNGDASGFGEREIFSVGMYGVEYACQVPCGSVV